MIEKKNFKNDLYEKRKLSRIKITIQGGHSRSMVLFIFMSETIFRVCLMKDGLFFLYPPLWLNSKLNKK